MPLFPKLGPEYYNEPDQGILEFMEKFYTDAITLNQTYWSEGDIDTRVEAGDPDVFAELYGHLSGYKRSQFVLNKTRPIVEVIGGYQRRNRKSFITIPIENGDEKTADQYTKLMFWCAQQNGILETISDAFHGSLVTGMNILQIWMDYREDPISGNIRVDNCNYNSVLVDPYFRKADFSDCNGIWKRSYLTQREVMSLLPDHKDDIKSLSAADNKDGKFQFMPETFNFTMGDRLIYDEFYYRDYRKQKMLVDTQSGESMEWQGSIDDLDEYLRFYPQVTVIESEIPTVKLAVVVQGRVLYNGPNPLGIDEYPFVPVLAYYNPQLPYYYDRIQGVVRSLRDPQFLFNRFAINIADVIESQLNSGWIYKENAVINPKDLFQAGNGKVIGLKSEAQMTDVQKIPPGEASQSMFQLTQLFSDLTMQVSGVNEELMGSAVDEKAGILAMLRQGAGLTTLQRLFDQLDYSQKLLGKRILKIIQASFTPGKVARIIGEEPSPQFYNKAFGRYDAAVEEGLNTTTQKQMQFAQLIQLRELGIPISNEDMIDAATVQGKQDIVKRMQEQQQQEQQMQQMQMQQQMQLQQSQSNMADARAIADKGLGMERISRIEENRALAVERRAEASKDRDLGMLNLVKAIKEVQTVDLNQLQKLITLANMVKEQENVSDQVEQQKAAAAELYAQLAAQQPQQEQQPGMVQPGMEQQQPDMEQPGMAQGQMF